MIDGAVLAGYLAVAGTRDAGRVFDGSVDTLFDRLALRVEERLGGRAIAEVQAEPADTVRQVRLGHGIDAVVRADPLLARELDSLQYQLDHKVGRQFINAVRAQPCRVSSERQEDPRVTDHRSATLWARVFSRARKG